MKLKIRHLFLMVFLANNLLAYVPEDVLTIRLSQQTIAPFLKETYTFIKSDKEKLLSLIDSIQPDNDANLERLQFIAFEAQKLAGKAENQEEREYYINLASKTVIKNICAGDKATQSLVCLKSKRLKPIFNNSDLQNKPIQDLIYKIIQKDWATPHKKRKT